MSGNLTSFSYYSILFFTLAKINEKVNDKFSSLLQFFEEKDLLNTSNIKDPLDRDSLIKKDELIRIQDLEHALLEIYSSDEDSTDENSQFHYPTVKDVIENLWDEKTIIKTV